jgi:hypothetical protein
MQYTMIEVEDCKDSIAYYLRATIFKQTDQNEKGQNLPGGVRYAELNISGGWAP